MPTAHPTPEPQAKRVCTCDGLGLVCNRCKRPASEWPLRRGDRCSPDHWVQCITTKYAKPCVCVAGQRNRWLRFQPGTVPVQHGALMSDAALHRILDASGRAA